MQLTGHASRKLQIVNGIAVIAYIALKVHKPKSAAGQMVLTSLLAAAILLSLLGIALQLASLRRSSAGSAHIPQDPDGTLNPETGRSPLLSVRRWAVFAAGFFAMAGRHALLLLLINRFDGYFHVLFRDYGRHFVAAHRVFVDLALAELLVLLADRFCSAAARRHRSLNSSSGSRRGISLLCGAEADRAFLRAEKPFLHAVFFAAFAYVFFYRYMNTTMYKYILKNTHPTTQFARVCFNVLLLLAVFEATQAKRHLVCFAQVFILAVGFLHYKEGGKKHVILAMCILIVAAANKDLKRLLLIFVIEGVLLTVFVHISMRRGVLINLRMNRLMDDGGKTIRYALGSISQTDYSAHLLFTVIAWCMIRPVRSRWWAYLDYPVMFFLYLIAARLNHATANALLILAVIAVTLLHQFYVVSEIKPGRRFENACRRISLPFSFSFVLFFVASNVLALLYTPEKPLPFGRLSALIPNYDSYVNRLRFANEALKTNPLSLIGVYIREIGNGGALKRVKHYSFLDISYVRMLLIGGILFTAILLILFTWMQLRTRKSRNYYWLFLLFIVSVNCLVEHHIYEFQYIIFPVLAFMTWPDRFRKHTED